jgi:hypothetical protein
LAEIGVFQGTYRGKSRKLRRPGGGRPRQALAHLP